MAAMTTDLRSTAMTPRPFTSAAQGRHGNSGGLHPNPSRGRPASTTAELARPRHVMAHSASTTSFCAFPLNVDLEAGERTPLVAKVDSTSVVLMDTVLETSLRHKGRSLRQHTADILQRAKKKGHNYWLRVGKIVVVFAITLLCCITLVQHEEEEDRPHEVIAMGTPRVIYHQRYDNNYPVLQLRVLGPFMENLETNTSNIRSNSGSSIRGSASSDSGSRLLLVSAEPTQINASAWQLYVNQSALISGDLATFTHQFRCTGPTECNISLHLDDNDTVGLPLLYSVVQLSSQVDNQVLYGALVLLFVYILIICELVHRTLAAMLGALAALTVLAAINERPSTGTVIGWIEMETVMLLFGMMIIVAVISETGLFDFCALKAYQLARGRVWPLVTLLCVFSAVVSAFLDNVTTILLMAPVTIRLCEVLNLEPRVILIAEVLFSNIGGTATAIGDPPNVIIVGELEQYGITFSVFTGHLMLGILLVGTVAYGFLRLYYRHLDQLSNPDPPEIAELQHEIAMWRRAAARVVVVTREETLMRALFLQKALELETVLNNTLHRRRNEEKDDLSRQLQQLEKECQIKDVPLLMKCGFVLTVILTFFFISSFVPSIHIGLGWIAVLGAMWLLVIGDLSDLETILHKVEWSTLIFFAALFILMEALVELHLMEWIGEKIQAVISSVDTDHRLTASLVIIVWVSALASSFIDNIPYTTAMIPVLKQLSEDADVNLPLLPLVVSLAFGTCLGGNGTLIGASANVVCAGIAEQHGYTISFKQFFKVGFPMMLVTTLIASTYLLLCHIAIKWN